VFILFPTLYVREYLKFYLVRNFEITAKAITKFSNNSDITCVIAVKPLPDRYLCVVGVLPA